MEKIHLKQLVRLLEEEPKANVVTLQTREGKIDVFPASSSSREESATGFTLPPKGEKKSFSHFEALKRHLKRVEALRGEEAILISVDRRYSTAEDFLKNAPFQRASMSELLSRYSAKADSFELAAPFDGRIDKAHPTGFYYLPPEKGEEAVKECYTLLLIRLKEEYLSLKKEPPFDEIEASVRAIVQKNLPENEARAELKTAAQLCGEGFLPVFTGLFDAMTLALKQRAALAKKAGNILLRPPHLDLADEKYEVLKHYLKSVRVTFFVHNRASEELKMVYRFFLNKETKDYLSSYSSDYEMRGLEDLAFFREEKMIFCSHTREKKHFDYSNE